MTSPALADIRIEFAGTDVNRTYPRDIPDLFEGGQLVLAGRYRNSGRRPLRISGKVGGERRTFEFPAELAYAAAEASHDFVEKLWATRRVGDLIDQIDMNGPEQGADRRAGRAEHEVRHPHAVHVVPGRRAGLAACGVDEQRPQPGRTLEALSEVSGCFGCRAAWR